MVKKITFDGSREITYESAFATVRHRTVRMKGALSQDTARLMVFKLVMAASKARDDCKDKTYGPPRLQGF